MKVYLGQVTTNHDPEKRGAFTAFCQELDSEVSINYTSPYHAVNEGGFLAVPVIGALILFAGDAEKHDYYYISTVVSKLANQVNSNAKGSRPKNFKNIKDANKIYGKADLPQQIRFTDYKNSGLLITNKFVKESKPDLRVQLQSQKGKVIALNDSPKVDMINIETAHGDGMFIVQGKKNKAYGYRSIHIKAANSINLVTTHSAINMTVIEGNEVNIRNLSFGLWGFAGANAIRQIGNVNLNSRWRDVNIWTNGPQGAIFIRTPFARIQIEPGGRIYIAGTSVAVNTAGTFSVNAAAGINLTSAGPINIKSATTTSLVGVAKIDLNNPTDIATMGTAAVSLSPSVFSGYEVRP